MKKTIAILLINILIIVGVISIACSNVSYAATRGTSDSINEDNYQAIKSQIDQMKKDHPNWQFEILYTGLDWNTVIQNERNKNSVGTSYLGTKWTTGAYMEQNWVVATDLTTSYLMDVRYFLNENNVFQFLDLTYSGCDRQQIVNMVSGTFLNNTSYIDALISSGQKNNVSPYFLAAKILQEQGPNQTSPLATGAKFTYNTEVYEGLYNLFNIGATGKPNELLIRNGLRTAQLKGWTSIEKSIEGGADFIKTNYISKGQTSAYLQKFDVENSDGKLYANQYMTNVFGAQSEGWKLKNTYQKYGGFDNSYKFTIPVYENMPKLTDNINLAKLNVSTTLSLKAEPSLASTKVGFESGGNTITVISKATSANSTDGYYWDLVVFNNGMIGYMARGDSTKTYLASYKEMSIAPTGTVEITENYVEAENMSIIKAYSPQGFAANKDSSWKLSQDGKTYSKEYTENTDYYTTFTLTTGSNLSKEVKVTKVDPNGIKITKQYNEERNSVVVSVYSPQGFAANKDSSWILSIDGKTYSKEYTENTNYYTTFTFKDGTTKNTGIRVESVDNNKVGITKKYNKETNIETVSVYNPQGFTANKDDNWKLSQDGKTYTKEYTANTDYTTTFTLKNGIVATARIAFTDIEDNKLTLSQKYNPETNITTVSAYCSQQFTANKDVSWKLSADGRTYSKEFTANTNYTTTFTLKNGVKKSENIVVANIVDTNIQLTQNYNGDKNTVTVKAYNSQGFTANKDTSWSLSTDGKTYSKEFLTNINVTETFTLKSGYVKKVNIVVTSVIDNNITVSEKYNKETNISTAAAYCAQGFTANKDTSWKLSADGKTYSKEYTANTNYYTTFTLKNGIKKQQNIVVASIVDITTKVTQNLNTVTNIVTVNVYSNQGFTANKDASWKLSQDTKTYSKEYNTNVNASETFTLKSGYIKQENIVVTSIVNNNVTVSEKYNPETNIATAVAYCASGFTANKDTSWKLSTDGKTYSKDYTANTNYYTTFTLKDGTRKQENIVVTSIVDTTTKVTQNFNGSTVTVKVYANQGFTANKDASWILSQDTKTYSKEYNTNVNASETFTLKSGYIKQQNIVVTSIVNNNVTVSEKYNKETNIATAVAYCAQGFTANKDTSWKLSTDGKTYSKDYTANTNYYTTFTLKDGTRKQENIVVASIVDTTTKVTQNLNGDTNIVTINIYSNQGFTANKDTSWKLSTDGKTYSKEYNTNVNLTETFTLKSGYIKQVNIVVTGIAVVQDSNAITLTTKFNEVENSVTVEAYSSQGFTANKDVSWKLSDDGKTYSKKYIDNTDYTTTFTLKNGVKKSTNIKVTEIDTNKVGVINVYDETKNKVTIYAYNQNGFVANKDISWKLSDDGKTYSKEYTANTNYSTTFTLKNGSRMPTQITIINIK